MGAGASSVNITPLMRLRKAILLRAYNARKYRKMMTEDSSSIDVESMTLRDQFREYAHRSADLGNALVITVGNIIKCISPDQTGSSAWIQEMLKDLAVLFSAFNSTNTDRSTSANEIEIKFGLLMEFLETGKIDTNWNSRTGRGLSSSQSVPIIRNSPLPDYEQTRKVSDGVIMMSQTNIGELSYTGTDMNSLNSSSVSDDRDTFPRGYVKIHMDPANVKAVVVSQPRTVASLSDKSSHIATGRQLWKKKEIVRQERTVEYTTVDENGEIQELIESEVHQKEIVHMECRDTGEFAHRETTHLEQTEEFNGELVNVVNGVELYVHMKSLEDEIEFVESTMPKREPETEAKENFDSENYYERDQPVDPEITEESNDHRQSHDSQDVSTDKDDSVSGAAVGREFIDHDEYHAPTYTNSRRNSYGSVPKHYNPSEMPIIVDREMPSSPVSVNSSISTDGSAENNSRNEELEDFKENHHSMHDSIPFDID